jgi:hypothetical protein
MDRRRFLLTSLAGALATVGVAEGQPARKVLRTALALGLTIPQSLLGRPEQVIE